MMQNNVIAVFDLESIDDAAKKLMDSFPGTRVFAFFGEMGSGKTTIIKAVCRHLGVEQSVTSPTFALVNEYTCNSGEKKLFHFDFYRIERIEEVLDMGYEDYFFSDNICFIEWPEKVSGLLPEGTARIGIDVLDNNHRQIRILNGE